ncbi:MAG TPA: UDP-N-acetylmuramoyl-L-alanine--D-glutamate ligase [Clostridiales bacterium]|nr:UDP-N-acetylmuramoyl-L-alanine--D-glutamate ligase [Clostridiales bacterium]
MDYKQFFYMIKNKRIAMCGIGVSNTPLIIKFLELGAKVYACDRRERHQIGNIADELESAGAKLILGENYLKNLDVDIIFRTPGMNFGLPELVEARKRGIAVTSEMEVFFDLCPAPIFAVTGSDGKTTTTTLIAEMLKAEGKTVHVGGNIGHPLLPEIEKIHPEDVVVAELSSFQLISMRKSPDVAVVTNISPNHLDIHKDMDEYVSAKLNILIHQNAFSRTVLNDDCEITKGFSKYVRGQDMRFSMQHKLYNGAWLGDDGDICVSFCGDTIKVMNRKDIAILGDHNVANYLAAISAVFGHVSPENIKKVAREFKGVEHRIEFVRELDGVKYYNDSIATSPTRTIAVLNAFDKRVILIAGGYDKHIPFDPLVPVILDKVKILILTGPTAEQIESAVKSHPDYNTEEIKIFRSENLEQSVRIARQNAEPGDIVTLSPACASFDAYPNFAARGNHFKQLVNSL